MTGIDEMSRVVGNLEAGLNAMNKNLEDIKTTLKTMDTRLSHIEEKEQRRTGAIATLSFIGGAIGALLFKFIGPLFGVIAK